MVTSEHAPPSSEGGDEREELARALSLLRATLEATDDGILVTGEHGEIVTANQRLLDVWRLPPHALEGKTYADALDLVDAMLVDPDHCRRRFAEILASSEDDSFDLLHLHDGRTIERVSRPQRLGDRIIGRVFGYRDVTDREKASEALRASVERMQALAEMSRELGEARLDLDAIVTTAARLLAELFQDLAFVRLRTADVNVFDTAAFHHVDPEVVEAVRVFLPRVPGTLDAMLLRDIERTGAAVVVDLAGSDPRTRLRPEVWPFLDRFPVHTWMGAPLRVGGSTLGYVVVARFRSAPAYTEDDRAFLQSLIDRAAVAIDNARLYAAAQDAIQLRDDFLLAGAHELRTPLTPLLIRLQVLERTLPALVPDVDARARAERAIDGAQRDLKRVVRLVNELVEVAREGGERQVLHPIDADLAAIVEEAVAEVREGAQSAGCVLHVDLERGLRGTYDVPRLRGVVLGLLENAFKFGARQPVEVQLRRVDAHARLTVRDHGIGIAPEAQKRLFGRFERAVSARHFGGLGLGLFRVRRIVEAHGGTVRIESAPGRGSTFVVDLPSGPPTPG